MGDKIEDGGFAFPRGAHTNSDFAFVDQGNGGMSLRDWFAGQALAGLLSANATYGGRTDNRDALAEDAFKFADAMLRARKVSHGSSLKTTETDHG